METAFICFTIIVLAGFAVLAWVLYLNHKEKLAGVSNQDSLKEKKS